MEGERKVNAKFKALALTNISPYMHIHTYTYIFLMHRDLLILTELADEKLKILVEEGESAAVYCVQLKVCAKLSEWYLLHVHTNLHALRVMCVVCTYVYMACYLTNIFLFRPSRRSSQIWKKLQATIARISQTSSSRSVSVCVYVCMYVCMYVRVC